MSITSKLKDLFVIRRGGGQTKLEAGQRYALTREGSLKTIPNENTDEFNQYVDDKDALVLLGDRGDLRQIETITRNLSVLFNNMVDQNEMYMVTPESMSAQVNNNASYAIGGLAYCNKVRIVGTPNKSVTFTLFGSHDNAVWEQIGTELTHTFTKPTAEVIDVDTTAPKYRFFKIVQGEEEVVAEGEPPLEDALNATPITGVVFMLRDKSVSRFFEKNEAGDLESLVAKEYDLSLFIDGTLSPDQYLYVLAVPKQLRIRTNFDGFLFNATTKPLVDTSLSILHNEVEIGTVTIKTTGSVVLSALEETVLEAGDWLALKAPNDVDSTISNLSVTLSFDRVEADS